MQLGAPTFSSRAEFEAGQGAQPAIPFEILNLWNNCNSVSGSSFLLYSSIDPVIDTDSSLSQVTIRWVSAQSPQIVTGIIVLEVKKNSDSKASQKWLIKTVYSEFNSGMSAFFPFLDGPPPIRLGQQGNYNVLLTRPNPGAWLVNLGVFVPPVCPAPPPPTNGKRSIFV